MHPLLSVIPKEQMDFVFENTMASCEIDGEFLGFTDIYEALSKIIPKEWTIIDLGCAYNPQCYYFTEHKEYIAVDIGEMNRFQAKNCTIILKSIEDFIKEELGKYNLKKTFAICNYVPTWGGDNGKMVREAFPNLYVFYPSF